MKKHNENDGGARDLDALLLKLKERHDAREHSGIYTPEDEFKRRFFQAARAQERPHFPMIWKAAAGIAVCLLAFQLVLTTLKDDSSAVRSDNFGAQGVDMVVDAHAPVAYGATAMESVTEEDDNEDMILASAFSVDSMEEDVAEMDGLPLDAGFSGSMLRAALASANDETKTDDAVSMPPERFDEAAVAVSSFGGGAGGFGGAVPAGGFGGGMGGFGGGISRQAMDMEDGAVMMEAAPVMDFAAEAAFDDADAAGGAPASKKAAGPTGATKSIQLKPWTSGASYLKELESAKDKAQERYLELRKDNASNLGFFVDCADYFARNGQKDFAIRVVSNLAEMQLENRMLLRVLGYNLKYLGELDAAEIVFRKVLELAPEEPQSYRDLALVLAAAGRWQDAADMMMNAIVKKPDGRFRDVELIAITELNNIIVKAKRAGIEVKDVDSRLVHPLEMDLRVTIGWDTDMSDMDLHTIDPTGEECFYQHRLTTNGGRNSFDITQGYGPEEFMVRAALNGDYKVKTHYYGQSAQKMIGPVTLYAEIVTDFGRPEEKTETLMFRLATRDEMVDVATVTTKGSKVVPKEPERRYPPKNPVVDDPPVVIMGGGVAPDVSRMYQVRANETLEDIAESQLGDRSRAQDIARENADRLRDGQPVTGSIITLPPRR